jgi:Ca-activated chloride channel family protein
MLRFANPEYLYLLLLLIPFAIAVYFDFVIRKKLMRNFADEKIMKSLSPEKSRLKYFLKSGLMFFSFLFLILAIANPQIGTKIEEVKQVGIDVYILLDVSNSMAAEDIRPNRLEKAKFDIQNLISKLQGDRIGLIIFAGRAYVQFPLTTDYSAANLFLSAVDFNSVPQQGTNIGEAINMALNSFKKESPTKKAIVMITDGEDHEGDIESAISVANDKNVPIYSIGLGSNDGVPIPILDNSGNNVGFKQDNNGEIVMTKLDETTLVDISTKTDGKFYNGQTGENELEEIYADLMGIERKEFGAKQITDYEDRFYLMLFPALLLLIAEFVLTSKKIKFLQKIDDENEKN